MPSEDLNDPLDDFHAKRECKLPKFKLIISDSSGKSKSLEVEGSQSTPFLGRRIGETVQGSVLGLRGTLLITGGSDKDGFPLVPSVRGGVKKRILLSEGVGFRPKYEGERRRKLTRGNVITDDVVQINLKLLEEPGTSAGEPRIESPKDKGEEGKGGGHEPGKAPDT